MPRRGSASLRWRNSGNVPALARPSHLMFSFETAWSVAGRAPAPPRDAKRPGASAKLKSLCDIDRLAVRYTERRVRRLGRRRFLALGEVAAWARRGAGGPWPTGAGSGSLAPAPGGPP